MLTISKRMISNKRMRKRRRRRTRTRRGLEKRMRDSKRRLLI
jgi:hypothetical protein